MMRARPSGLYIVIGTLAILFGVAEVVTGLRQRFFVLHGSASLGFSVGGVVLGLAYMASGVLVLVHTRRSLMVASALLAFDVVGRVGLVVSGVYPLDDIAQVEGIAAGTAIAAVFMLVVFGRARSA